MSSYDTGADVDRRQSTEDLMPAGAHGPVGMPEKEKLPRHHTLDSLKWFARGIKHGIDYVGEGNQNANDQMQNEAQSSQFADQVNPVSGPLEQATLGMHNPGLSGNDVVEAPNMDLNTSDSSVQAIPLQDPDGNFVLLPVGGQLASPSQAWEQYQQTGEHLGIYTSEEAANQAAQYLQGQQAQQPDQQQGGPVING